MGLVAGSASVLAGNISPLRYLVRQVSDNGSLCTRSLFVMRICCAGEKGRVPRDIVDSASHMDDGPCVASSPTAAETKSKHVQNTVPFSSTPPTSPTAPVTPIDAPASEPQLARHVSKPSRAIRLDSKSSGDFTHRDSFADSDSSVGSPNMHRAMTMRRGTAWAPTSPLAGDEPLNTAVDVCVREWTNKWTHALIQGRVGEYQKLKNQVYTVLDWKRQLAQVQDPAKNAYIRG